MLPTADQLERLTLRSIAAYAVRGARRVSVMVLGVLDQDEIDRSFRALETFASTDDINQSDEVDSLNAAASVARAMVPLRDADAIAALAVFRTASMASNLLGAANKTQPAQFARRGIWRAARAAAGIGRAGEQLGGAAAIEAARRDYEILRNEFGEHDDIVVGDPVDLSEKW